MTGLRCVVVLGVVGCAGGGDDGFAEPPAVHLSVATTGELSMSYVFEAPSPSAGWSGDESDCTNVRRGVRAASDDNTVQVNLDIDGCTVFSEGAPPVIIPGQMQVTQVGGESYNSAYYDGANDLFVDGCLVTIAEVFRWEDSWSSDNHLFVSGTYTCEPLFSGFGDDDTQIIVTPGTFTFDWTGSEVN